MNRRKPLTQGESVVPVTPTRANLVLELFDSYYKRVYCFTRKSLAPCAAEDIAQEAFIKSYKSIDSFREESSFYTWVYRITVNTAKNYLVSSKRRDEVVISDLSLDDSFYPKKLDVDSPQEILKASELRDLIFETLSSLGEETRTALSLREFDGLSYEQIAEIVQCPVGTVRSRIFRGREMIEEVVGKHMDKNSINQNTKIS